ncbi:hypothetical protein GZ78_21690 [Endozoicomonas numazuensis]|uniref:Uncharacterized protein n=1 Tax=Endozoicomonas numazuensis TaxID=1137799 RepID=A0A081NDF0_9GAMM|nr:hypothetical protein GZ78_21690 [Endozoicomonas numazuensis]
MHQSQSLGFTENHLKASVQSNDLSLHEAPIVIGHPKDNAVVWFFWLSAHRKGTLLFKSGEINK